MSNLKDNIFFTRKARIQTAERLLMNNTHAQFALILYSLVSVALSISMLKVDDPIGKHSDIVLTVISVFILVISLVISNVDFKGRADKLKENYLELHSLELSMSNIDDQDPINSQYMSLLSKCENHKTIDDKMFRVLHTSGLTSRKPDLKEWVEVIIYFIARKLLLSVIYLGPFILIVLAKNCV